MSAKTFFGNETVVSGQSVRPNQISPIEKTIAFMIDTVLFLGLGLGLSLTFHVDPIPSFGLIGVWFLSLLTPFAFYVGLRATPGQLCVRARADENSSLNSRLKLRAPLEVSSPLEASHLIAVAAFGLIALLACGYFTASWVGTHPVTARATERHLTAWAQAPLKSPDWWTRASYYALGTWPSRPFGKKIVHALPYEEGPPRFFPGRIVSKWDPPQVQVTFEGPKTPEALRDENGRAPKKEEVRACFLDGAASGCWRLKQQLLSRHLSEIRTILGGEPRWKTEWLVIDHAQIPEHERPEGLLLSARKGEHVHKRFIAISPEGTHQAFFLEHQGGANGAQAEVLFEQSISTLKVTDDLGALRAWAARDLLEVKMKEVESLPIASPEFFEKVTDVQSILLSRVSVQPNDFDAYYHLAGTASLLLKHALETSKPELTAAAERTLESAVKYARDVAPKDPRNARLESLLPKKR